MVASVSEPRVDSTSVTFTGTELNTGWTLSPFGEFRAPTVAKLWQYMTEYAKTLQVESGEGPAQGPQVWRVLKTASVVTELVPTARMLRLATPFSRPGNSWSGAGSPASTVPLVAPNVALSMMFKCGHYERDCEIYASCCDNFFACQKCHDETAGHNLAPVTLMRCRKCQEVQAIGQKCSKCNNLCATYFCAECVLWAVPQGGAFHCPLCRNCLLGAPDKHSCPARNQTFQCPHYTRGCHVRLDCCPSLVHACAKCHQLSSPGHQGKIGSMVCLYCRTDQPIAKACKHCFSSMASHFCELCVLWANTAAFHCVPCGRCFTGTPAGHVCGGEAQQVRLPAAEQRQRGPYEVYLLPPRDPIRGQIEAQFFNTWTKTMDNSNWSPHSGKLFKSKEIKFVLKLENQELESKFQRYVNKGSSRMKTKMLWHGTTLACDFKTLARCGESSCPLCNIAKVLSASHPGWLQDGLCHEQMRLLAALRAWPLLCTELVQVARLR